VRGLSFLSSYFFGKILILCKKCIEHKRCIFSKATTFIWNISFLRQYLSKEYLKNENFWVFWSFKWKNDLVGDYHIPNQRTKYTQNDCRSMILGGVLVPRYPGQASSARTLQSALSARSLITAIITLLATKSGTRPRWGGRSGGSQFGSAAGSQGPPGSWSSQNACWPNSGRRRRSLRLSEFCADFWRIPSKIGVRRTQSVFPRSSNPLAETLSLSLNIFGTLFCAGAVSVRLARPKRAPSPKSLVNLKALLPFGRTVGGPWNRMDRLWVSNLELPFGDGDN